MGAFSLSVTYPKEASEAGGKYGQVYIYKVYRHSAKVKPRDGRNPAKTPQKCTIKVVEPVAQ